MSEEEMAKYYQQHKDDPEEWGPPQKGPGSTRRFGAIVSCRFTSAQFYAVATAAAESGQTVSAFIRAAAMERIRAASENVRRAAAHSAAGDEPESARPVRRWTAPTGVLQTHTWVCPHFSITVPGSFVSAPTVGCGCVLTLRSSTAA